MRGVCRTASVFQPELQVQGGEAGAGGAEGGETEPPDTTVQGGGVLGGGQTSGLVDGGAGGWRSR